MKTKMKTKILSLILILLVSFVCVTCSNSKKQEYFYENGNIKERLIYSNKKDTSFYSVTRYYLNGQISEKGTIKDGYKEGTWEYWYSDGEIRWKENFSKGIYQKPINVVPAVAFQKDTLYVGEKVYMRVKSKKSLIKDFNIGCSNGIVQRADNGDLYDFMVIPARKGILKLYIFSTVEGINENTITQTFTVY